MRQFVIFYKDDEDINFLVIKADNIIDAINKTVALHRAGINDCNDIQQVTEIKKL